MNTVATLARAWTGCIHRLATVATLASAASITVATLARAWTGSIHRLATVATWSFVATLARAWVMLTPHSRAETTRSS